MAEERIPAGRFKAQCLKLMDEVATRRHSLVVTKRGKPVVRIVPVEAGQQRLRGALKGLAKITGDIVAPTGERWDADR
ncbi:MAG: type II toxin-antitoxin system Phd/YefM family antitoxin [Alphaproteobacteria bacterium]|nr:type II toxin-antitoxin system Phd/YefM family antitoxin [Alphaproteobacteria bacterium]